jgi:hypothetical protein
MKYLMTTRLQQPMQQGAVYLLYDLIFITLACLSHELWLTLLCAFLSALAAIKAISLFAHKIFYRDKLGAEAVAQGIDQH